MKQNYPLLFFPLFDYIVNDKFNGLSLFLVDRVSNDFNLFLCDRLLQNRISHMILLAISKITLIDPNSLRSNLFILL